MTIVSTSELSVAFGDIVALERATLEIPAGVSVAVLGPNGSGKTTLLATLAGVQEPTAGSVALRPARVAYLPQHVNVEPTFPVTLGDVVAMGRWGRRSWLAGLDSGDRAEVGAAIAEVGLSDLSDRPLAALSVGQRQRAFLAQAIAQDAELMLLDEPFAGVDRPASAEISRVIAEWRDRGRTVLVATHDLEAAARDYDLVIALNRRVVAFGPAARACTEEVLRETFSGHVARVGDGLIDTSHHHHDAG